MAKKLVRSAWGKSGNSSFQSGAKAALADGAGSATSPEYKQTLADAVRNANLPGADGYVSPYESQFKALLGNATNAANTNYGYNLADSAAGEGATALDLGATLGYRPTDAVTGAYTDDPTNVTQGTYDWNSVDATNPFSKAGLFVKMAKQERRSTTNGYADAGQLNSGAAVNARSQDTFAEQQGQDQLQKALQSYLSGQARSRRDASVNRDNSINNAGLTALQTLLGS